MYKRIGIMTTVKDRFPEKVQLDYVRVYGWKKCKNGLYTHVNKTGVYTLAQAYREQKFNS